MMMRLYPATFLLGLLIVGLFRFFRGHKIPLLASKVRKKSEQRFGPIEDIENEEDGILVSFTG